jgi:outer membrane receptor protein involved in Fe transport
LHAGQDVSNQNPSVDLLNLPVDNSIEYNPTASRNVHHVQLVGDYAAKPGAHSFKTGFIIDQQSGHESYQIVPASRLALDALAALDPKLAPAGYTTGATDVDGNPVYVATSSVSPTLNVSRNGYYAAVYAQDTWSINKKLSVNYGARGDWYSQSQNLEQEPVYLFEISPRVNFSWAVDQITRVRWSYDHLFNTPPLAQGAIVGEAIKPETLNQYDIGVERRVAPHQTVDVAYYYKQINNQVDVGLLVPGSEIGLYSGVNFQKGAVHGLEVSYDIAPPKGIGWDTYANYTLSAARPNGLDNTGAPAPEFNDHDQRQTLALGAAYTWKSGALAALTFEYGSGLTSSIVRDNERTPRSQADLRFYTGDRLFKGSGGLSLDIQNVFDDRSVINFESGFSGTRFVQGRQVQLTATYKF